MSALQHPSLVVGRIGSVYGVRGWLKIYSYTDPKENIFNYQPWHININDTWQELRIKQSRRHGSGLVAQFFGCEEREYAKQFTNTTLYVYREQLSPLVGNEYYWTDLQGLTVITLSGNVLGKVTQIWETGANDVLVVKGDKEHLIPYLLNKVVTQVDLPQGVLHVDWDPDF